MKTIQINYFKGFNKHLSSFECSAIDEEDAKLQFVESGGNLEDIHSIYEEEI